MAVTRHDIKALAKERHPSAVTVELRRHSDFQTLGILAKDTDHPDWLLIIAGGGDMLEYKADTLDELHAMLNAEQGLEAIPT